MQKHNKRAINLMNISHRSITGGFVYVQNLLDHLLPLDPRHCYILFVQARDFWYFKKRYGKLKNVSFVIIDIRYDLIAYPIRAIRKLIAKLQKNEKFKEQILTKQIQERINKYHISLFLHPTQTISPKGLLNVKQVITVYDLQHEYLPELFSKKQLEVRRKNDDYIMKKADHLLAISEFTRQSVIKKYDISPEKITTTILGPHKIEKKPRRPSFLKLPEQFIFYPAALWPHKNHIDLVDTLNQVQKELPDLHIVFTGIIKKVRLHETLKNKVREFGLEKRVHFLGFVSDEELAEIYNRAIVMAFPSSFEGFGMPILEAFEHDVPVIAANNSSISEVIGDAGILFETNNVSALAEAIKKMVLQENIRREYIAKGREQVRKFSWDNTAKKTLLVFNALTK